MCWQVLATYPSKLRRQRSGLEVRMKKVILGRNARGSSQELGRLKTSLLKVRILYYVSVGCTSANAVAERLHLCGWEISNRRVNSLVAAMNRNGWLKSDGEKTGKEYRLSAEGKQLLSVAKRHLEQLQERLR
jgi:DNA-binding PadR family transcriptional regulator